MFMAWGEGFDPRFFERLEDAEADMLEDAEYFGSEAKRVYKIHPVSRVVGGVIIRTSGGEPSE